MKTFIDIRDRHLRIVAGALLAGTLAAWISISAYNTSNMLLLIHPITPAMR